jgi:hypothetical protein
MKPVEQSVLKDDFWRKRPKIAFNQRAQIRFRFVDHLDHYRAAIVRPLAANGGRSA